MNKLANEIGLKYTTYANPHGLPNLQNGSTAEDISILIARCLEFSLFRQVIKCK
jgi:D-alanyl-D-alanine carboxypeptidase